MTENYAGALAVLESNFEEVNGYDFYRYVFPDCEDSGELHDNFSRPNAIYLYRDEADAGTKRELRRRIMLKDTWEQDYMDYVECNPMTLCSGLTYRGRTNKLEKAQQMNAMVFDIDGVGQREMQFFLARFDQPAKIIRTLPRPTFVVLSGSGVHLWYVFNEPIDLFPNIKVQLKSLKHDLTFRLWEYKATSQQEEIQYQSINQGFRMVGSINDKHDTVVRAFQTGGRVSLAYLNQYTIHDNCKVDLKKRFRPSKMTRAEAEEKFPEWYQRVVVEGNRRAKKWDIAGKVNGDDPYALYHWWMRFAPKITGGHRYFYLMCLSIYACKCDVPKKQLREDMKKLFSDLKGIKHTNPLTERDIDSALEAYSKEYYNFTITDIEKLTGVRIERNKRNGRKQADHLKRARAVQTIDYPDGEWRNKDGRPKGRSKEKMKVADWRKANPEGRKADCIRETGLSKPTVYRWWGYQPEPAELDYVLDPEYTDDEIRQLLEDLAEPDEEFFAWLAEQPYE